MSPASKTAAFGSTKYPTAAFANPVYFTTAFGTQFCVTAGIERASFKSCLHQMSAAFVTAANANPTYVAEDLRMQYS